MFGLFKKKPQSLMSDMATAMYGEGAKSGKSNISEATKFAFENLLGRVVPQSEVADVAKQLRHSEMPYSTEDLALVTALNFFSRDELKSRLASVQLQARMQMLTWLQEGRVNPMLVQAFEHTLYTRFKPGAP